MGILIKKRRLTAGVVLAVVALILVFQIKPLLRQIYKMPHADIVERMSQKYQVDHYLIYAMMKAESSFRIDAQSHVGAKGLMQVMDATAQWAAEKIGIADFTTDMLYDPEVNIEIGCWYIAKLLEDNDGALVNAVAAYNAGEGNLRTWQKECGKDRLTVEEIPFADTRAYVEKVLVYYSNYQKIYSE